MSIVTMREEFQSQLENISSIVRQLNSDAVSIPNLTAPMVFTGSGDSWAAALFAMKLDWRIVSAVDPRELSEALTAQKIGDLVIVSSSGRTRANVELAEKAKHAGVKTVAITADETSPLARICDKSLVPKYNKVATLTSGTISFTASLLACASLLRKLPKNLKLDHSFSIAEKWASRVSPRRRGKFLFIGAGVDRALAEYGACKVQEVLGATAVATYPEQVGHAMLFSLQASDTIVGVNSVGTEMVQRVCERLRRAKFNAYLLTLPGSDMLTRAISACLCLQLLPLKVAEERGQKECAFIQDEKLLRLSNSLIY